MQKIVPMKFKITKEMVGESWRYKLTDSMCKRMFQEAERVVNNTYPKPGKVVCSVVTTSGTIYPGVNYYSDTYTATMHAEMVALAHAATHGEKEIVAVTGPNCHLCKQLLWENSIRSGIDIMVVFKIEDEKFKMVPLSEMMVYAWPDRKVDWAK